MQKPYEVINVNTGESHGTYETLERARGCVEFDQLKNWEIWEMTSPHDGLCVTRSNP